MKIVQIINEVRRGGGAEALLFTFSEEASAHDIDCSLVSLREAESSYAEQISSLGVPVVSIAARKLINPWRFFKLVRYLKSVQADLVHTHLTSANILGVLAARLLNIPSVVSLHNVKMVSLQHPYHGKLECWLLKHWAGHIVAVGDNTEVAHRPLLGDAPMTVIPNAVNPPPSLGAEDRKKLRQELFPDFNGLIIMTVGRLHEQKGYDRLLQALSQLTEDYRCIIVGDGELRDMLTSLSCDLGLQAKVSFLGIRQDIGPLLSASDLYVSSSLWEGLPVATLEAMYARLPIVATRVGDVGIILENDAGVLVEPDDVDALAGALDELLGSAEKRAGYGDRAFNKVDADYNAGRWMQRLKSIYQTLL
ncbi:MAG: glycosyltransferase [Gammaproteobacteria bacterium]|nr:glycosyltransferase [Gammaproteobacteria bacterium]